MAVILPQPVYPRFIDSDYTLYNVSNTAETSLSKNLEAWAKNIFIVPVNKNQNELWSENGFITINGELIYYNAVTKDSKTGKVIALRNCIRNVDGKPPKFAPAGTYVRGFVVAQHHNQLARSIVNIENLLSTRNTTDKNSLGWKLNYLNSQQLAGDDSLCPQTQFTYSTSEPDAAKCITITFNAKIQGKYKSHTIYFGDGNSDSLNLSGTHTYAPNQDIDPYIEVQGFECDCIITDPIRDSGYEPEFNPDVIDNKGTGGLGGSDGIAAITSSTTVLGQLGGGSPVDTGGDGVPFTGGGGGSIDGGSGGAGSGGNADGGGDPVTYPDSTGPTTVTPLVIPDIPDFPSLDLSIANVIDNQTQFPPIVFPTLDIGPFGPINIPSQISLIQTTVIPSQINFLQTDVIPSIIQFNNIPPIPSIIGIVAVEKIPDQIAIEPVVIDMLDSEYSVNCTAPITLNNTTDGTEKYETLTESDTCDTKPGQNDTYGGPDTNKIQKVQVVVHDFLVKSPTSMYPRYDAVKILIEDPPDANNFTRKCLVMGSGFAQYKKENIPQHSMNQPVTLVFDDKGKRNFYNFAVPLQTSTYATAPNSNNMKRNLGLANLSNPAPDAPYSSQLNVFTDRKIGLGKWRAYVVVGKGPAVLPTPRPTETPLPTETPMPTSATAGTPLPTKTPKPTRTPKPTPTPIIPNKIPETIVSIGKICVRIYYYKQDCPLGTATPTPTALTPTPEPWPTFPPYPTFPHCINVCEPTCAGCTPSPTMTKTPTPTPSASPTPTPTKSPTPTPSLTPDATPFIGLCEFACFDGWYRLNGSPDGCPSCDEYPELLKPCVDTDPDYLYLSCPHL